MPPGENLTQAQVVDLLRLERHPEGGWYRETFRDGGRGADGAPAGSPRALSTAIYFLLGPGETSRWHRVDAAEVWHFYAGAALNLFVAPVGPQPIRRSAMTLGNDLAAGERPQGIVPAGYWQQAQCLGTGADDWSLVGCTVAPGFEFAKFELAPGRFDPAEP